MDAKIDDVQVILEGRLGAPLKCQIRWCVLFLEKEKKLSNLFKVIFVSEQKKVSLYRYAKYAFHNILCEIK